MSYCRQFAQFDPHSGVVPRIPYGALSEIAERARHVLKDASTTQIIELAESIEWMIDRSVQHKAKEATRLKQTPRPISDDLRDGLITSPSNNLNAAPSFTVNTLRKRETKKDNPPRLHKRSARRTGLQMRNFGHTVGSLGSQRRSHHPCFERGTASQPTRG